MCADCHTTNFAKELDAHSDTYHSSWSETDVSCEACHGPGSIHVELADSTSFFRDRRYGYGLAEMEGANSTAELGSCTPCHAHRQRIHPGFKAGDRFYDHYGLSVLEDHLYHADGQTDVEVYVFGAIFSEPDASQRRPLLGLPHPAYHADSVPGQQVVHTMPPGTKV
ncbi:MAG: multiheme c-type cytochrome [Fuerstiella sp.]|nr:multiheme c-type cytochrome [Fuerstiella sp.]